MSSPKRSGALRYCAHASAPKEIQFFHIELIKQAQAGQIFVLPYYELSQIHKLWISPLLTTPQWNICPHMIYHFMGSNINIMEARLAPLYAMDFGNTLHNTPLFILNANPSLGIIYPSKVDLYNGHMRIWVLMGDVSSVDFLIPKKCPTITQLVGFHLSLPMGYVESSTYFCTMNETVTRIDKVFMQIRNTTPSHQIEALAYTWTTDGIGGPTMATDTKWKTSQKKISQKAPPDLTYALTTVSMSYMD